MVLSARAGTDLDAKGSRAGRAVRVLVKLPVTLQYAAWGPSLLLTRTVYGLPLIGSVVFA